MNTAARRPGGAFGELLAAALLLGLSGCGGGSEAGEEGALSADADPPDREWTAGVVDRPTKATGPVLVRRVEAGRHPGFDRMVWEFAGDSLPGLHVEYVDEPVRACGSGRVVPLPGDGWLRIAFQPARGHSPEGRATVPDSLVPALPVIRKMVRTCDFEAVHGWTAGVVSPEPFRVLSLRDPTRIAVDVRHPDARGEAP
ncbi:MAG: hypothetical protein R3199_04580 [Gemmatimonadota bacterium]|nr:hypothetical protein [Gemmatimonadota bacterium]